MWMKTKIKIPKKYKPDEREAIAFDIIEKIVERTQQGKDKKGEKFPSYSKSYKESLNFKISGKTNKVDLTLSGDMLADLQLLNHKNGEITIGYENGSESNAKAEGNILGTYGSSTPRRDRKRDFLGVQKSELSEILGQYPTDDLEIRRERVGAIKDLIGGADRIAGNIVIGALDDSED